MKILMFSTHSMKYIFGTQLKKVNILYLFTIGKSLKRLCVPIKHACISWKPCPYTQWTHIYQPLKRISQTSCMLLSSTEIFEASMTNIVDPDQTAPVGAVWYGSTLFASLLALTNKQTSSGAVNLLAF